MGKKVAVMNASSVSMRASDRPDDPPPTILTDPKQTLDDLVAMTNALGGASGQVRETLRPLNADTLEKEVERLRIFAAQQPRDWGGPLPRLSQLAIQVVTSVEQFIEQVDIAQALRDEIRPLLDETLDHIRIRRAGGITVLADVERLKDFETEVVKVQRAFTSLDDLLAQAETWVSVARISAARTCEAAGRIIAAESVSDLTIILQQMATKIQTLRSTKSPALAEILEAIRKAEHLNSTHIRLPEIIWQDGGDMFAPPKLREWNEGSR